MIYLNGAEMRKWETSVREESPSVWWEHEGVEPTPQAGQGNPAASSLNQFCDSHFQSLGPTWFSIAASCPCLSPEPSQPPLHLPLHTSCRSGHRSQQNSNWEQVIDHTWKQLMNYFRQELNKCDYHNAPNLPWMLMYECNNIDSLSIFASHASPFVATVYL